MSRKKCSHNENNLSSFGARFRFARKELGYNLVDFGKLIGIKHSSLSQIENNNSKPSSKTYENICRNTNINLEWLLSGTGDPFLRETFSSPETLVGQLKKPAAKQAPIYNEGETQKWDEISLGRAVDQLQKIYSSKDPVLIRAINANLDAFTRTVDLADEVKILKDRMAVMEANMKRMEKIIDELGRREECCVHAVIEEGRPPDAGDPTT